MAWCLWHGHESLVCQYFANTSTHMVHPSCVAIPHQERAIQCTTVCSSCLFHLFVWACPSVGLRSSFRSISSIGVIHHNTNKDD